MLFKIFGRILEKLILSSQELIFRRYGETNTHRASFKGEHAMSFDLRHFVATFVRNYLI